MSRWLMVLAAAVLAAGVGVGWSADPSAGGPIAAAAAGAPEVQLPVTKVVLFSSGVGYFEHTGAVDGDAEVRLMFKTEQINDVLKSMVVTDAGGGTVRRVSYAGREPLERALKSFGVDLSEAPTLGELLAQLRGAEVIVAAPEKLIGKVFNVEERTKVIGQPPAQVTEQILDLVSEGGIKQVPIETIQSVRLANEQLDSELNKALELLVASRDKDRKPVDIEFAGKGRRRVRIGYIIETPIWKTSYRLDLGEKKPLMQGWAIVDNTTDADWGKVELTLVSGRPISFVQDLYTPLFVPRPVVVPELYASLRPPSYEEGIGSEKKARQLAAAPPPTPAGRRATLRDGRAEAESLAKAENRLGAYYSGGPGGGGGGISLAQGVEALAAAGQVGELFQYTIRDPVNLARRRSAMLPVINAAIVAEKVSIYNQQVMPKNPLNGVYLTNDTGMKMLAGPVTVLDGGMYAGDARLDNLAAGDKRLLSYAVDLNVTVDPSASSTSAITAVKIVRGVLQVTRKHTFKQDYLIHNKADVARTMIVEHPFSADRKLVEPEKYEEKTAALYRFRVPVAAGETGKFTVLQERTDSQTIAILPAAPGAFRWYTTSGEVSKAVQDALARAIAMKDELTLAQRKLATLTQQLGTIETGQSRLRENLKVVGNESQLGKRYLQMLNDQEDEIARLKASITEARDQADARQKQLEDYLRELSVE